MSVYLLLNRFTVRVPHRVRDRSDEGTLAAKILTQSIQKTRGSYGLFSIFVEQSSGTWTPELCRKEIKK